MGRHYRPLKMLIISRRKLASLLVLVAGLRGGVAFVLGVALGVVLVRPRWAAVKKFTKFK